LTRHFEDLRIRVQFVLDRAPQNRPVDVWDPLAHTALSHVTDGVGLAEVEADA
jgi:hypothetical protein